jgi:uncharacterized membrane protein YkvA (DUF1232 family)
MSLIATLKTRARQLKAEVAALYFAARHPGTPWYAKLLIVAIVAYALSPIDLIPDFIPVLGFLDEIILLPLGIMLALKMVPAGVMIECRARVAAGGALGTRAGRIAAAVIVILWVGVLVLAGTWAYNAYAHEHRVFTSTASTSRADLRELVYLQPGARRAALIRAAHPTLNVLGAHCG